MLLKNDLALEHPEEIISTVIMIMYISKISGHAIREAEREGGRKKHQNKDFAVLQKRISFFGYFTNVTEIINI